MRVTEDELGSPPVYLISSELPGCGSTTLARDLTESIGTPEMRPHTVFVGQVIRKALGVTSDDELVARLKEINDPNHFDPLIYGALPTDQVCIVEGKLATTAGPHFLSDRETVSVTLESSPLFSAKRVMEREGAGPNSTCDMLLEKDGNGRMLHLLGNIATRSDHDRRLREKLTHTESTRAHKELVFDTRMMSAKEITAAILGNGNFEDYVPEWELNALEGALRTISDIGMALRKKIIPNDREHFEHQKEAIQYNLERLAITLSPLGIAEIRKSLREALIDCWYGLMMKEIPRYFVDKQGILQYDIESHSWSPEYYKVAEGWPTITSHLRGKTVLDPFAGSGTLMSLLVARGIPKEAYYSDLSYAGGKTINGSGYWYQPQLNVEASRLLFDTLPSWYRPDFSIVKGFITANAFGIPLKDNAVDYVFADPPYGKNLNDGGIGVLFGSIKELVRVSREGAILLVPVDWLKELRSGDIRVTQLTKDVSRGHSGFPVCYIKVEK